MRNSWEFVIYIPQQNPVVNFVSLQSLQIDYGGEDNYSINNHPSLAANLDNIAVPGCLRFFYGTGQINQICQLANVTNYPARSESSDSGNFWWDEANLNAPVVTITNGVDIIKVCSGGENPNRCEVDYYEPAPPNVTDTPLPPSCPPALQNSVTERCLFIPLANGNWIMKDLVLGSEWHEHMQDTVFREAFWTFSNWDVAIQNQVQEESDDRVRAEIFRTFQWLIGDNSQIANSSSPAAGIGMWWYFADAYCTVLYPDYEAGLPLIVQLEEARNLAEFNERRDVGEWTSTTNSQEYQINTKDVTFVTHNDGNDTYFEVPNVNTLEEPVGFRCVVQVRT
jgi:hypothetical protein